MGSAKEPANPTDDRAARKADAVDERTETDSNSGMRSLLVLAIVSAVIVALMIVGLCLSMSVHADRPAASVDSPTGTETPAPDADGTTSKEEAERRRKEEEELRAQDEYVYQQNVAADLAATSGM